jgi:hypothetical protein
LRPFQVARLILGRRLAPTTSKIRGGPGHSRERRINLSTVQLCSEAPCTKRTVSVHVMWDAQEKLFLDLRAFVGFQEPHARPPMGGRPFVSPGQRGHGCRGTQAPSPPLPGTFTGQPPYSVRKGLEVRDLGIETREMPTNLISTGILGAADQGKAVGATSWRARLPAMHLVSTPDPNPGRATQREVAAFVKGTPKSVHSLGGGPRTSAHPCAR